MTCRLYGGSRLDVWLPAKGYERAVVVDADSKTNKTALRSDVEKCAQNDLTGADIVREVRLTRQNEAARGSRLRFHGVCRIFYRECRYRLLQSRRGDHQHADQN
jgi:hypothetical protein